MLDYFKLEDRELSTILMCRYKVWLRNNDKTSNLMALALDIETNLITRVNTGYYATVLPLIHLKPTTKVYHSGGATNEVKYTLIPNNLRQIQLSEISIGNVISISSNLAGIYVNKSPAILLLVLDDDMLFKTNPEVYDIRRNFIGGPKITYEPQPSNSYIERNEDYYLRSMRTYLNSQYYNILPPYLRYNIELSNIETEYNNITGTEPVETVTLSTERLYLMDIKDTGLIYK